MLTKTIVSTFIMGMVLLPLTAQADVLSDVAAGSQLPDAMLKAMRAGEPADAVLRQVISRDATLALPAITSAVTLNPDQAATIVSTGLDRRFNLAPLQVLGAALEAAPDRSAAIVSTAIVRSPSYYATPIVLRAVTANINGSDFMPQALRAAPQQADAMLTQVLRAAPYQRGTIMKAVIADQPQSALRYVSVGLGATRNASADSMLQSAFEVVPRQAKDVVTIARSAGVSDLEISSACQRAGLGVEVCGGSEVAGKEAAGSKPAKGLLNMMAASARQDTAEGVFADLQGRFNITPLAGYRVFGQDQRQGGNIDDGAALAVSIGYQYAAPFAVEARIAGTRDDAYLLTMNGLYSFGGSEHWSPFVMGQLGSSNFKDGQGTTERLALGLGGGVFYRLSSILRLRAEVEWVDYDNHDHAGDIMGLVGIELAQRPKGK